MDELTPEIHRWVYIATTAADFIIPSVEYSFIIIGALTLVAVFVRTYKDVVFTAENLERGMEELRTGSTLLINASHHRLQSARQSVIEHYSLLKNAPATDAPPGRDHHRDQHRDHHGDHHDPPGPMDELHPMVGVGRVV